MSDSHATIGNNQNTETKATLERLQNLYQDSRVLSFTALVASTLVGLMLWSSQPQHLVIIWIVAHMLIAVTRGFILHQIFKKRIQTPEGAETWVKLYALAALISGFVWASLPWTMFDPTSTYNISAIVIVMFGMAASSNVALSAYPAAFFCFAIPSLGGLFFRLMSEGGDFTYVAIMLIAFTLFNLVQSIRIYKMVSSSIRQRYENIALMHNLEIKKQEADKANIDKSRFLAATSHDLRQPLHALDLYMGALETMLKEDNQTEVMLKAKKSSQSVSELLNALLDISRLDAGEVEVHEQQISIPSLFLDIQSEWSPQLAEDGRALRIFSLPYCIRTDPVLLSRVLGNVIANAVRHTSGDVLIGARLRKNIIRLEVWDQGDGIPQESLAHVFTEYFQLNNPERDRTKGLGLGLATVQRLAQLLNHSIHINSFPSRGLCFCIDVPLCSEQIQAPPVAAHFDQNIAGSFIVIIDDEEAIRDGLQTLLAAWGCEVFAAESADAAVEEMKRDKYPQPDAIIADYRLRENKTGINAATQVMNLFNKNIPTLIVTGDKDNAIRQACHEHHYNLLHKPIPSEKLHRALQKLLPKQP